MNLLFADKPSGLTTHTSLGEAERSQLWRDPNDGFLELLSTRLGVKLWPVHRLDRETSGAIAFAKDKESAARARELFEKGEVDKRYFFLTDRPKEGVEFEVTSRIERVGNEYVSRNDRESNSRTRFKRLSVNGRYSLWHALPATGKPHQIRLHAEDAGISILGDSAHGGSEFPALCLLSHTVEIDGQIKEVTVPQWFDTRLLDDRRLCKWLVAIDRRRRWWLSLETNGVDPQATTAKRIIHSDGDPLRVEILGAVAWLSWFSESAPSESEWKSLHHLIELQGWKNWMLQVRGDRGRSPNEALTFASEPPPPETWMAKENGLAYEFRSDSGLSPGLFLDQRRNREWLAANAKGKTVLNLFCYTGGFSVAAASGGATKTVSVDVSKTFLEWAKRNFAHNSLSIEGHEFRAIDGREYLAWAAKKGLAFDVVVCDPPSFSRSKSGLFKLEKDFDDLLKSALAVTAKNGTLLFACNYEAWSEEEFVTRAEIASKGEGRLFRSQSPDPDFELPSEVHNMKSILIRKI